MSAEFDPGEELSHFPDRELYDLPRQVFLSLIGTCRVIEAFSKPMFFVERGSSGCFVEFLIRKAFWIEATPTSVKLWTARADEDDLARKRCLVHEGSASDARTWEGMLVTIGRIEQFHVQVCHADNLRRMWSEWLIAQKRLRDERGF